MASPTASWRTSASTAKASPVTSPPRSPAPPTDARAGPGRHRRSARHRAPLWVLGRERVLGRDLPAQAASLRPSTLDLLIGQTSRLRVLDVQRCYSTSVSRAAT